MKQKVEMTKVMQKGDRFTIHIGPISITMMVMAVELNPKGLKNTYWVIPVVKAV